MLTKKCMNTNSKATAGGDGVYVKLLVTIALISRAYNVIMPASIVYDEMFTFKYAKAYLTRTFAFDVHPPLTKMIIAFLMGLFGLDLELNCEIGESLDTFFAGYIALRLISVILFTLSLLMTYSMLCTIRKNSTALFMSLFLVFEVAFQVHYGLIMQDSWVFFYQTAMLYACVKYHREKNIKWVYYIGLAFSFAISSKHSAIFTALPIVTWLLIDLFYMACDSQVCIILSRESVFMHAMHRFASMVVVPLLVYLTSFYIHFKFQNNYSDDALNFSLRFQSQLANNYLEEGDKYIIDRSLITLINKETKMYIKSENRFYDTGSKQQVVYADGEKNERSIWSVVKIHIEDPGDTTEKDMFLKNGDYVKLVHILTDRYLHSHHVEAPTHYEKKFKEVSCYGSSNDGVTDDNDYWVLKADTDYIMARESKLNLFHVRTGTFLAVNTNTAEGRQEVYSSVDGAHKFRDFYIEDNKIDDYYSNNLPDPRVKEKINAYKPLSFLEMIFEYHRQMLKQNLEIDAQRSFASSPFEWPLMKKGILYWNSFYAENYKKGGKVIYLTGNYVNWALALLIFMMPFVLIINKSMLAKKRTIFKFPFMVEMMFWIFVFNYAPLFLLSREMYLHNYLFAYYHALLVSLYIVSLFGFRVMYIAVTCSFAAYVRMLGLMGVHIDTDRCLMHNLGDVCMTV